MGNTLSVHIYYIFFIEVYIPFNMREDVVRYREEHSSFQGSIFRERFKTKPNQTKTSAHFPMKIRKFSASKSVK